MSISTLYAPVSYVGDGTTDEFPVTWSINASSEIVVTETIIATGVETIKTLTTHYTVTGTGPVTVTAVTAPASTVRWTIGRNVPSTQLVDYVENDSFPAATHEAALDKLTMLSQEHDAAFLRTLRQPDGDTADIDYLPPKITRASMYAGYDSDGDPIALDAPTTTSLTTAFTQTLLDDTDLATFLATLGMVTDTWVPSIAFTTPGDSSIIASVAEGTRFKFGNLVIAQFQITTSTFTHTTASGDLVLSGLEDAALTTAMIGWYGGMTLWQGITKASYTQVAPYVVSFTDTIKFRCSGSAQTQAILGAGDMPTGGTVVLCGFVIYHI